ncbi:hypothetical protein ON010_g46 [Phytophthora cinnamomi]|nr:hypothetical protein ON010_g46 [Phytophthora cinnamomi]
MGKKRRQVAAPATQRANREAPVDLEAVGKALAEKRAVYDELVVDIAGVPASLERTLLLHSLVALVVQNALMVSIEQVPTIGTLGLPPFVLAVLRY